MSHVPDPFDGETLDVPVPAALDGLRVDRVVAMLTGRSRRDVGAALARGAVTVDERVVARSSHVVRSGQHLVARVGALGTAAVVANSSVVVDVVYEDDDLIVVNKAPGQVVHPGSGHDDATLVAGLLARYPVLDELASGGVCDASRPGIVHRLDKGTSGLLVVALSEFAFRDLVAQMAQRRVTRTYVALAEGHMTDEAGVIDAPIGRSARTPTLMTVRADGRPARTHYEVLERVTRPHAATLLQLRLETGRTHQIRVHLAAIGHPVVNDTRYGHRRDQRLAPDRLFLHATQLVFTHPRSGDTVTVRAELPGDLRAVQCVSE